MSYSYGFNCGGTMGNANDHVVRVAFKRGDSKKGNQRATVYNAAHPSNGLWGQAPECGSCKYQLTCIANNRAPESVKAELFPCTRIKGLSCTYHSTVILEVDLIEKSITCNDFGGWYTPSTSANFNAFVSAARYRMKQVPEWVWREFPRWTQKRYFIDRASSTRQDIFEDHVKRFKAHWVVDGRFLWETFDERLAKQFTDSLLFLGRDFNYRYFKFTWTDATWGYHFINADAERRWKAREKRRKSHGDLRGAVLGVSDGASSGGRDAGIHDGSGE
jgi:hypothetical protein